MISAPCSVCVAPAQCPRAAAAASAEQAARLGRALDSRLGRLKLPAARWACVALFQPLQGACGGGCLGACGALGANRAWARPVGRRAAIYPPASELPFGRVGGVAQKGGGATWPRPATRTHPCDAGFAVGVGAGQAHQLRLPRLKRLLRPCTDMNAGGKGLWPGKGARMSAGGGMGRPGILSMRRPGGRRRQLFGGGSAPCRWRTLRPRPHPRPRTGAGWPGRAAGRRACSRLGPPGGSGYGRRRQHHGLAQTRWPGRWATAGTCCCRQR